MQKKINVLLLAGGKSKISMRRFTGKENKALIEIDPQRKPMILYIIKALKKSKYTDKIIVAGPEEVQKLVKDTVYLTISDGQTIPDTLKSGILSLKKEPLILISTCDAPLITEKHIDYFIKECYGYPGFDIYYPIIDKEVYQQSFPSSDLRRVYANLVEGTFTGGNILLINPQIITDFADIINDFIYFRKHPLKMARLLGARITTKYLRKYLSIQDLEKKVPELLRGYKGKAILSPPEIALDIDKPRHLKALWHNY
ncbi:MAG: nucleotidyltransferase family protein [Candidatus Caldatribacteriota bacterium]|nr:nucleotidyltransferase family protein [Candidatus Caldatribacteriota bacterium]